MQNVISKKTLGRALLEYDTVKERLNRPAEDLVMIAEFELIKKSVKDFLTAFLLENGAPVQESDHLCDIQNQCANINKDFRKVDLTDLSILCDASSHMVTNNLEGKSLAEYVKVLDKIRELVIDSLDEKLIS